MKNSKKSHSFCEGKQACHANYCDENGCLERKRSLVDDKIPKTMDNKEAIKTLRIIKDTCNFEPFSDESN